MSTITYLPSNVRVKRFHTPNEGHGRNKTGYGRKIVTDLKAFHNGRWYRVYASCFGNVASYWVKVNGKTLHLPEFSVADIKPA